jgi:hypothetical protein
MKIEILRGKDRHRRRLVIGERSRSLLGLDPTAGEVIEFRPCAPAPERVRMAG